MTKVIMIKLQAILIVQISSCRRRLKLALIKNLHLMFFSLFYIFQLRNVEGREKNLENAHSDTIQDYEREKRGFYDVFIHCIT